jgi:RHS repeat-associated protein
MSQDYVERLIEQSTSEKINGAGSVSFAHDNDGLLTGAGGMTLNRDLGNGRFIGSTLGNVVDSVSYDGFGAPGTYAAQVSGVAVYAVSYVRDGVGRIVQKTETIQGQTHVFDYAYDLAGRLWQVLEDEAEVEYYEYDANGNRTLATVRGTTVSGAYDEQDRLATYGTKTYTFSHTGQLAGVVDSVGGSTWSYTYDALGNLRHVGLPSATQIDYVVDGENHRIWKRRNQAIVQGFVYADALRVAAELDAAGNVVARFVYGDGVNVPDAMIRDGATYRILKDHLGSPRLVVDTTTGAIAQRIDYDAFGNVLADAVPGFQPFGFAGGLYDHETRLVRFGARDYDAATARWTARDPMRFAGKSTNLFAYANNDPIGSLDPLGLAVQVCGGVPLNPLLRWISIPHRWLRTSDYAAGLEGTFLHTEIGRHTDDITKSVYPGFTCEDTDGFDEDCVTERLRRDVSEGKDWGPWLVVGNNCWTYVDQVLYECSIGFSGPPEGSDL